MTLISRHGSGEMRLLLMPGYSGAVALRARLAELQQRYGGSTTTPVHLVCQKLRAGPAQIEALQPRLKNLAADTPPLELTGLRLEPYYSTFHQRESLKCHVEPSDALSAFSKALAAVLKEAGLEPLLRALDLRVTLLSDVRMGRLEVLDYPEPLFMGQRLVLARLSAPERYRALSSVSLGQHLAGSDEELQLNW